MIKIILLTWWQLTLSLFPWETWVFWSCSFRFLEHAMGYWLAWRSRALEPCLQVVISELWEYIEPFYKVIIHIFCSSIFQENFEWKACSHCFGQVPQSWGIFMYNSAFFFLPSSLKVALSPLNSLSHMYWQVLLQKEYIYTDYKYRRIV